MSSNFDDLLDADQTGGLPEEYNWARNWQQNGKKRRAGAAVAGVMGAVGDASKLTTAPSAAGQSGAPSTPVAPSSDTGVVPPAAPTAPDKPQEDPRVTLAEAQNLKLQPIFSGAAEALGIQPSSSKLSAPQGQQPENSKEAAVGQATPKLQSGAASFASGPDYSRVDAIRAQIKELDDRNSGVGARIGHALLGDRPYQQKRAQLMEELRIEAGIAQTRWQDEKPQMAGTRIAVDENHQPYYSTTWFDPRTHSFTEYKGGRAPSKLQSVGAGGAYDTVTGEFIGGRPQVRQDRFGNTYVVGPDGTTETYTNPAAAGAMSTTPFDVNGNKLAPVPGKATTVGRPAPASAQPAAQSARVLSSLDKEGDQLQKEVDAYQKDNVQKLTAPDEWEQRGAELKARIEDFRARREAERAKLGGAPAPQKGAPAKASGGATRKQFKNQKTGKDEWFRLVNGQWTKE